MTRRNQSQIILFIMGSAIVLAAVLSLAVSSARNPPAPPVLTSTGEQVVINDQVFTLRGNPALRVVFAPPAPVEPQVEVVVEQATPVENVPQPTPVPAATNTPAPVVINPVPTNTVVPAPVSVQPVILMPYVVQSGDTLYGITTQKATSIALMAQYGIAQDNLNPGETISVPVGNPAYCPGRRPYAVGEGETIFAISTKNNTTKEELQAINQLNAEFAINAGQILCVP